MSPRLRDITDHDDKIRMFFCGECSFQGNALAFDFFDDEEPTPSTPSLWARIRACLVSLLSVIKRHKPRK